MRTSAEATSKPATTGRRRKRIGFIFASPWKSGGGDVRALSTIINVLSVRGFDVEVLTYDKLDIPTLQKFHGLKALPKKAYNAWFYEALPVILRTPVIYLWTTLKSIQISKHVDFIIFFGYGLHPARFIPYSRNKVMVYQNGYKWNAMKDILASSQGLPRKILRIIAEKSWPRIFGPSRNHYYVIHNSWAKKRAEADFGLRVDKVLHLPGPDLNPNLESRRGSRVVDLGRFWPEKRHELSIEFVERVAQKMPEVRLFIIGMANTPVTDEEVISSLIQMTSAKSLQSNVSIMKNLPFAEIIGILQTCRVLLCNQIARETIFATILEGMACGCIPIIPKVSGGGWEDFLEYGKYGFGFQTTEEAIEEILWVLSLPDDQFRLWSRKVAQRAKELGEESFANALEATILEVLGR